MKDRIIIDSIKIIPVKVPYIEPISISVGTIEAASNIIVEFSSGGYKGYGEFSPFIYEYSGENQESGIDFFTAICPKLLNREVNIREVHNIIEKYSANKNFCARSALDIAFYDLVGKIKNKPVYSLLGGKYRDTIDLLYAVDWTSGYEKAIYWSNKGFKSIMIKVGRDVRKDLENIIKISASLPKDITIIVDPNQKYTVEQTIWLGKKARGCMDAIEGPIDKDDIRGLVRIKKEVDIPIIADEYLVNKRNAEELLKYNACDLFLIKPLRSGGFYPSMGVAKLAQDAGVEVYCASLTNLGIGQAANLHFAVSVPNLTSRFGCGFENLFQIYGPSVKDVEEKDIATHHRYKDGKWFINNNPGLGIKLKWHKIREYQNRKEILFTSS